MKKQVVWAFVVLCGGALFAGGCATQDVVKKDEPIAPSAVSQSKPVNENSAKAGEGKKSVETPRSSQTAQAKAEPSSSKTEKLLDALEKIYFDFDSTGLSEQARTTLAKNAETLKKNPTTKIRIEGNCDERGSEEYNLALGENRAKTAMKYLVTMGIPEERLSVISYGKEKPADAGHEEAAWAKNRRDEFVISSK